MFTRTFKEEKHNRIIKFCTTVDDQSLIVITKYDKDSQQKRVQLLTSYTDYDIYWLIDEYKNHGILPLLISESIEHQVNCNSL